MKELMKHKKKEHTEKVSACRNYGLGNCDFGDLHTDEALISQIECKLCDTLFLSITHITLRLHFLHNNSLNISYNVKL